MPPQIKDGGQLTTQGFYVVHLCRVADLSVDVNQSKPTRQKYPPGDWSPRRASLLPDVIMIIDSQDHEVLYRALGVQRLLNLHDAIQLLRSEVKRAGSQRAFARKAGVNVSVVSKTLRGIVLPSEKILRALKLQVVYLSK
jgi:hypothetical protein